MIRVDYNPCLPLGVPRKRPEVRFRTHAGP